MPILRALRIHSHAGKLIFTPRMSSSGIEKPFSGREKNISAEEKSFSRPGQPFSAPGELSSAPE